MFFIFVLFNIFLLMDVGDSYNCYDEVETEKIKVKSTCDTENESLKIIAEKFGITEIKCMHISCSDGSYVKSCGECKAKSSEKNNVKCKCYECTSELCNSGIMSQFNWFIIFGLLFICIGEQKI
ncbi:hypothetical protein Mgra_00009727 [Meloidogyne graminicola]|uniref:Uncharacterized protein n=1 Tax=Meloidogyne graminicola TaxID=189291 RepID=A0A8S9Z732_9BILA|nr:hypothetical protein Mgra_00009727 [Meloidogyne graminicola]